MKSVSPIDISQAGGQPLRPAVAIDSDGNARDMLIADERPLTIYLDKREVVTLMTLGTHPEALVIGYLKNQGLVEKLDSLRAVQVDWETESAAVVTTGLDEGWEKKLERRTVTSGCGQGTMFGDLMESIADYRIAPLPLHSSQIHQLLEVLSRENEVYRNAGAVHACALCDLDGPLYFVEDVGRHNAVDAIAGMMWLDGVDGAGKIFYTTGRLTSEMVIKVTQMGVPVLLSRSGITDMGLRLAKQVGLTLIARAKGRHFLIYSGAENIQLDIAQPLPGTSEHA